jgi:membrane associated rhomboid family serine protease
MLPIRDTVRLRNPPVAVWILIFANVIMFLGELMMPPRALVEFIHLFGIVPARYTYPDWAFWAGFPPGDYWPFLTSMFLHGGWLHIFGNMWTLWIFGDNVEDRMGSLRFVAFYFLCGLSAGVVHWFVNQDSTIPTVGASGAVAGVMGAYLLLFPYARIVVMTPILFLPLFFELPAVTYLVVWVVTQVFSGTLSLANAGEVGPIAWWAHVGGFATGMALKSVLVRRPHRNPNRDAYAIDPAWSYFDR